MKLENEIYAQITDSPLSIDECYEFISDKECGGNCIFIGSIRDHSKGKEVVKIDFEAYDKMALKEIKTIAGSLFTDFPIKKIYMVHRKGVLKILDIAVIIGVSSVHRDASFQACRQAIDLLKQNVPIWKKEFFKDGFHWVNAHP